MTRRLTSAGLTAAAVLAVAACKSVSAQPDVPAVITAATPESRAELASAVTAALGMPVALADDALTRSSVLTLERREPRDAQGRPLTGRTLDAPEQFQLVWDGRRCVLVRTLDGNRTPLAATSCRPVAGGE